MILIIFLPEMDSEGGLSLGNHALNYGDYGQYVLSTQTNYTLTYYADHGRGFSHDVINAYVHAAPLPPSSLWKHIKGDLVQSPNGYIVFDDTVLDKRYSHKIERVRTHYSGNEHGIITGLSGALVWSPACM
jgi:hypothetical protein